MARPATIERFNEWMRDGAMTAPSGDVKQFIVDAVKALDHAAVYISVCPPPLDLGSAAREAMRRRKEFIDQTRGVLATAETK
jgi:hypothetical protein